MSQHPVCIVVGASHAGSQLALQLRRQGWEGRIVLIGDEEALPYHRPPLSKAVMAGEKQLEDILLRPAAMYDNNQIELRLGTRVQQLLPQQRQLCLEGGERINYDRLVLCTGARVQRLPLGAGLAGVQYLRSIADVIQIREQLDAGRRAVIIGAGYIGLEAAAVLSQLGLSVTVLERSDRVLSRVTGERLSRFMAEVHASHGVNIICNANVLSINGAERVESVSCEDGSRHAADLVIVGIGVVPETTLAEQAGLRVEDGICVDEHGQTSDPAIYAAGDCTAHPNRLYQRRLRLECVQNANDQARVVAANLCGSAQVYDVVPWFWSDQYGMKLQSAGLCQGYDHSEVLGEIGGDENAAFTVLYFREDRLLAADCINQAKVFMRCKQLVADAVSSNKAMAALQAL